MASQSKRSQQAASSDADAAASLQGATATLAEISRQQMAAAAETLSVMFRAIEAVQQAQLQMGQRAALLHSQAAENLRKATTPMEVMTIQSTLVAYEFQEALRYWQEFSAAMAKAGGQMMRPAQKAQEGAGNGPASMMEAAMSAAGPMADAFQQMFNSPLKASASQPH